MTTPPQVPATPSEQTVEEVVRHQLSTALGGKRGMLEAAIPTVAFTLLFVLLHDLRTAILGSVAVVVVLTVIRIVQRSTIQFCFNALLGIGIGALFAWRAAKGGGDAGEQALAYFLPGILYNAGYSVVMGLSVLVRWPLLGFMIGSVTGDPTGWRADPAVVRLCGRLTWVLAAPCVIRVIAQTPVYLAGTQGWWDQDVAIGVLAGMKLAMGWPLQVAALVVMAWLLSRNKTPMKLPVGVETGPVTP